MLKRILFAVAPMMLIASSVMADDSLLSAVAKMDLAKSDSVVADVATAEDLGKADVDALLGEGDQPGGDEAIAACFRRIGYGHGYGYGCGYRSHGCYYGHRSWYSSCYSPCYTTYSYSYPVYNCYSPCYSYCTPVYTNYWGCW